MYPSILIYTLVYYSNYLVYKMIYNRLLRASDLGIISLVISQNYIYLVDLISFYKKLKYFNNYYTILNILDINNFFSLITNNER